MENKTFSDLELSKEIQRAVKDLGFEEATAIQTAAIPLIMAGRDVIGHSQTGTGKTAAFGIPAIEAIDRKDGKNVQVLIVCPTRELAVQACDEIRKFAKYMEGVKTVSVYGGQPIDRQIRALKFGANIVVGTPGRIMDLMRRKVLRLGAVKMIVLDEADEMLNMGFKEDVETILRDVPGDRQTILFSATMSPEIMKITEEFLTDPELVRIAHQQLTVPTIEQYYFEVPRGRKTDALCNALDVYDPGKSIVFCNTKKQVEELQNELQARGYLAAGLHGDMRQQSRDQTLRSFKSGRTEILIATDVAARGIDVEDVDIVFNYDIPQDEEYYVHRIGRTGRAGKKGKSYSFVVGRGQLREIRDLSRYTGKKILLQAIPTNADIHEIKQLELVQEIREVLESGESLSQYVPLVDQLSGEEYTSLDIALALIRHRLKVLEESNRLSDDLHISYEQEKARPGEGGKGKGPKEKMVRFRIDIGRGAGAGIPVILSAVASATGLPGYLVGKIEVKEKNSTFDLPEKHQDLVLERMQGVEIKGRETTTVLAPKKPRKREEEFSLKPRRSSGYAGPRKPRRP